MITINSILIMIFISVCFTFIIIYLLKIIKDKDDRIENLHEYINEDHQNFNDLNDILNAYDSFKKEFEDIQSSDNKEYEEYKLMRDFINFIKQKNTSFEID